MSDAAGRKQLLLLGDRVVNLTSGRVEGPVPSHLTGLEAALLECLIRADGRPVGREALLHEAWGYPTTHSWRAVDAAIYRLRKKIEHDPNDPRWLLTVRGDGYRLVGSDIAATGSAARSAEKEAVARAIRRGGLIVVVGLPGVGRSWVVDRVLAERTGREPLRVEVPPGADTTALLHLALVAAGVTAQAAVDADGLRASLHAFLGDGAGHVLILDPADGSGNAPRDFARDALAVCPRVSVVVVAETPLGVEGEQVVPVLPLDPAAARAFLLERAPAGVGGDPALERLLGRLGGMPLALALAADCLMWCTPGDLAHQLERGVGLLDIPARRSGRAGVSALWARAWESLPTEAREALDALLPLVAPFTIATAEQVTGGAGVQAVLDLVGRGWIQRADDRGKYRIHPVLRSFVRESVGVRDTALARWVGTTAAATRRVGVPVGDFGRWETRQELVKCGVAGELLTIAQTGPPGLDLAYVALAAEAWLEGRAEPSVRRGVLDRALAIADLPPALALQLLVARARLELGWGDWDDARQRFDELLATVSGDTAPAARGWLLWYRHGGQIAGTGAEQLAAAHEARQLAARARDPVLEAIALLFGAITAWQERQAGSVDAVDAALQRAGALMLGAGELSGAVFAELHRSAILQQAGRWREAARARQRAGELDDASIDHLYRGGVLSHRAMDRLLVHDLDGAGAALREALAVDLAAGMTANRPFLLQKLALLALDKGALDEAERAAAQSLSAARGAEGRNLVNPLDSYVLAVVAIEREEVGTGTQLAREAIPAAGPREGLLLRSVVAYGAARLGHADRDGSLLADVRASLGDDLGQSAAVWLVGALLARGERARAADLLSALAPLELVRDYGTILLDRLRTAAGAQRSDEPPAPPTNGPPPDERSVLLRFAGRWMAE